MKPPCRRLLVQVCVLASLALMVRIVTAHAANLSWPTFRGPNGSGVSDSAKPPVTFSPTNQVAWRVDVPWSPSSPIAANDQLFLTTFNNGKLETRSYRASDGKLLWTRAITPARLEEFHDQDGSPAAASPVTDGKRVVSYFGSFGLVCYDVNGEELWQHPLPLVDTTGGFGSGTSPIIAGDLVIIGRDQRQNSTLLAVHLKNGKIAWETSRADSVAGFGTPTVWTNAGTAQVVMAGSGILKGYDLKTGREHWMVRGITSFPCTTPVIGEGLLYFAGWAPGKADSPWPTWASYSEKYDKNHDGKISREELGGEGKWLKTLDYDRDDVITTNDWRLITSFQAKSENVLVAIKPGGNGDITESHVAWKFDRGLPYVASPLLYQDRLYLIKDGGMVTALDPQTGEPAYVQERVKALGSYYSSPVAADGRIYVASLNGVVTVFKAGGDRPEILSQIDFGERIAATPALVGNRIYLRTAAKLYALGPN